MVSESVGVHASEYQSHSRHRHTVRGGPGDDGHVPVERISTYMYRSVDIQEHIRAIATSGPITIHRNLIEDTSWVETHSMSETDLHISRAYNGYTNPTWGPNTPGTKGITPYEGSIQQNHYGNAINHEFKPRVEKKSKIQNSIFMWRPCLPGVTCLRALLLDIDSVSAAAIWEEHKPLTSFTRQSAALLPPRVDGNDDDAEEPTRKKEIASPSTSARVRGGGTHSHGTGGERACGGGGGGRTLAALGSARAAAGGTHSHGLGGARVQAAGDL
ncbi:hypothetical protein Scep_023480 [Stephania cephalantha]|uniref:Uncharacterized protein n=1 Tax=Stephania cephalantha TaxID=152367 RepID=A0AAP0HXK1_9MAGN